MIIGKRLFYLIFCLTFVLLSACEPLAPELTPPATEYTPAVTAMAGSTSPATFVVITNTPSDDPVTPDESITVASGGNVSGAVNTPQPTITPAPQATAQPTIAPAACDETEGQVVEASFTSATAGEEVAYRMYLPPCFYDTIQRYPYVMLFHGTGFNNSMWQDAGVIEAMDQGIQNGTLPPMVLVMPDGGMIAEYNDLPEDQTFENVILDELIPALETQFCLWGSREGRGIGGISRGGFWAFSIALRNPEMFSVLGGHSPHFEADNALPELNPLNLVVNAPLDQFPLRIYMDNAAEDYVGANALRMSELLRDKGVTHTYLINPTGEHDITYWQAHVGEYLAFYGQAWPKDVNDFPSCLEPSPK